MTPIALDHRSRLHRPAASCATALLMSAALTALAASADAAQPEPARQAPVAALQPSPDAALVIDARARLAWPRCVEGMRWNGGQCTGVAQRFTYAEAQALARERAQADGVRWRLPRVNELRRLVERSAKPPAVDAALFPAAPPDWHWSGTASVNAQKVNPYAYGNVARAGGGEHQLAVQQSWAVDMASGQARGDVGRATALFVRLVRPAP